MDKEDVVHIYDGILLSHEKSEIMPFAATKAVYCHPAYLTYMQSTS